MERDKALPGRPVVAESLAGTAATDADLADLVGLPRVTALDLSRAQVTGRGLGVVLRGMPVLRTLDLSHTPLTDAALLGLDAHPALTELGLTGTTVSDAAIARSPLTRDPKVKPLARPSQPGK